MLLRLADIGEADFFDYCIIGTGPAGISCALALIPSGKRILLLEGGDSDITLESQSLYEGTVVGDAYFELAEARLRFLGGTSNHWNGMCRPLEAIDFEAKGRSATQWPIARPDLDPYLAQASSILEIDEIPPDRPIGDGGFRQVHFVHSPPVRFREKYRETLSRRGNVLLALNANLLSLTTNGTAVTGARVRDFQGTEVEIRAGRYVLATGGIENSRLLLWSNALANGALIRSAGTLGRYWTEHPHITLGKGILTGEAATALAESGDTFIAPAKAVLAREGMLNCTLYLRWMSRDDTDRLIADIACVAPNWARRAVALLGMRKLCAVKLRGMWEQEPVASNRIELAQEKDALGVPKVRLHWRKSGTDVHTIRRAARLCGESLALSHAGRLRLDDWVLADDDSTADVPPGSAGRHHMGGTRMANTPAEGIVDPDCKVFGQANLYIAGSSVFPSGGYCNPTLTIVQLALRLGEHLRAKG